MKKSFLPEVLIVILLTIVATLPRVLYLDSIPLGIHGDEAWTALDAKEIIEKGFIPIYSPSALGQPSGPAWITSIFFRFFGDSVYILRLSMAILGILTIPILYMGLRKLFSQPLSILLALLFAFSQVHLHFSRIGFMLISAPLFAAATLYFFIAFIQQKDYKNLILAALIGGVGMYTYNSYILFPPTLFLALLYLLIKKKIVFKHIAIFTAVFVFASSLLLYEIVRDPLHYFAHHKTISVMNQNEYKSAEHIVEKAGFIVQNGLKKTTLFFLGGHQDGADGFGGYQSIDYLILVLAFIGGSFALYTKNRMMIWFCIAFLMQLIPLFTTVDGFYRREIVAYLFLYFLAAYGAQQLYRTIPSKSLHITAIIAFLATLQIGFNVWQYFLLFPYTHVSQFVFAPGAYLGLEIVRSEQYPNRTVLLYSERFSCEYETFRYLLAGRDCIHITEDQEDEEFQGPRYIKLYIDSFVNKGIEKQSGTVRLLEADNKIVGVVQIL